MKKLWRVLLGLLLAVCLVQVGITVFGKPKTPQGIQAAAMHNINEIQSMRFDMELDMDVSLLEKDLGVLLSMQGEMTKEPSLAHGRITMDMADREMTEMEVYLEAKDAVTTAYVGMVVDGTTVWTEQSDPEQSATVGVDVQNGTLGLLELVTILADTEPEQISDTEMRYAGVIPADKISLALKATGLLTQLQGKELMDEAILNRVADELEDMPITILVNPKELIITGYELDMTSAIHQILRASLEQTMGELGISSFAENLLSVKKVTIRMYLYDFDQIKAIEIPAEVKQTAIASKES